MQILAFVRSGDIHLRDGYINMTGKSGYNWSGTARPSSNAYDLYVGSTDINASSNNGRWYGFPLRCLYLV